MADNSQRPFRGVFDMFSELNRMREHWTEIEPTQGRSQPAPWVPAVDIFASGQDLVIRCELAGVAKEEIDVSLTDGRLWISGERSGAPEDGADFYVRERRYGRFERSVKLKRGIAGDQISASVIDGLLEIVVEGGAEPHQHEQIEVTGADSGQVRLDISP
jgi:HSP20 family protein